MKVLLLGNYRNDRQYSMLAYERMLVEGLKRFDVEVEVIVPGEYFGKLRPGKYGLSKFLGYLDKFILFPIELSLRNFDVDLVHIVDHSNSVYAPRFKDTPLVITCHDVLAIQAARGAIPEVSVRWSGRILQKWIAGCLAAIKHIICVSQTTRDSLIACLDVDTEATTVALNPLYYPYKPSEKDKSQRALLSLSVDVSKPYLLHVGSNNWRKNRQAVLEIFARLKSLPVDEFAQSSDLKLVLVGTDLSRSEMEFLELKGLASQCIVLTDVDNIKLESLYSRAAALLITSLYEGFGLPPLEAMACECLVFASNKAPMTEVLKDAAVFIDPIDIDSAAQSVYEHLFDEQDKQRRIKLGLEICAKHSVESHVEICLSRYQRAVKAAIN